MKETEQVPNPNVFIEKDLKADDFWFIYGVRYSTRIINHLLITQFMQSGFGERFIYNQLNSVGFPIDFYNNNRMLRVKEEIEAAEEAARIEAIEIEKRRRALHPTPAERAEDLAKEQEAKARKQRSIEEYQKSRAQNGQHGFNANMFTAY